MRLRERKIMKIVRRIAAVFLAFIVILLGAATAIAIPLANNYAAMISMALGQSAFESEGGSNPMYYESAYDTETAMAEASAKLCREIEQEGMVLLKNENQALPLAEGAKVSLLSQNSVDLVYGGAGAGSVDASKAADLKTALENGGFSVNPVLWDFYQTGAGASYRKEVPSITGAGNLAAHEVPQELYTDEIKQSFQEYSDAAVIVIGRSGSESVDLPEAYLEFTTEEKDLIQMAQQNFDTVILLLNVMNAMNLSILEEYEIDACLWAGAFGQEGVYAVADVLNGSINPSGHVVDTWSYNPMSAPAVINQGDYTIENSQVTAGNKYIVYSEGIYVGYRYYETRYEDVVLGKEDADKYSYTESVQFPFGYGLSYTEFAWSDYQVTEKENSFSVEVTVKNSGKRAGKETVQIYLQNPYTAYDIENQIEKSSVELVGFAKTALLAPGESETVTVDVEKEWLKTYDANGYGTYIAEAGDYYLAAGKNAHEALNHVLAAKGKTTADGMTADGNADFTYLYVKNETDSVSYASAENGTVIENQLQDVDIRNYDEDFTYLSRSDWSGTWPVTYQNGSWNAPETLLSDLEIVTEDTTDTTMPLFEQTDESYADVKLADLIGADFEDARWETLLSRMSKEETWDLIRHAGYGTMAIESIGVPGTIHKDGPAGISSTLTGGNISCMAYPPAVVLASTWNEELAKERGEMVGEDSIATEISVWYAPAMNIHRSALSGRNFEYYAEDSFLSGKFGAAETAGFQSKGGIVTLKHFALNDQETNRIGGAVFANEQSAREIYLKPFEMSIVDGKAVGIMSSMNRIGARWIGGHKGVMTNILRGEWDYQGFVITDQTSFPNFSYCDIKEGLAAGNDLWLNTAYNMWDLSDEEKNGTVMTNARNAAHRYLYVVANSNAMNGIDQETTVKNVKAGWQKLIPVLVIAMVLIVFAGLLGAFKLWGFKGRKERK